MRKYLSKKEMVSLASLALFVPGGVVVSGVYLYKKFKKKPKSGLLNFTHPEYLKNLIMIDKLSKLAEENPTLSFQELLTKLK